MKTTTTTTITTMLIATTAAAVFSSTVGFASALMDIDDHNQMDFLSSACPTSLRDECTVLASDMSVLREGTNGWSVIAGNPRGPSLENGTMWSSPHEAMAICFDSEGMKWIQGYMTNTPPTNMDRDAWLYMYNGDMGEDNTKPGVLNEIDAVQWIESGPHVMLMPSDPTALNDFPTDPYIGEPYVMFAGTPFQHLMIPLPGYYDFTPSIMNVISEIDLSVLDHSSNEWKIGAFSSACPPELGQNVTVLDSDMSILRQGFNNWTAMPANPRGPSRSDGTWISSHEASSVCFDNEGLKWMQAYGSASPVTSGRDSIIYMLQGDMGEDNSKPGVLDETNANANNWIESGPHVMLMPKSVSTLDTYTTDFNLGEPYVMFNGDDYAHVMVTLNDYYMYQDESKSEDEITEGESKDEDEIEMSNENDPVVDESSSAAATAATIMSMMMMMMSMSLLFAFAPM